MSKNQALEEGMLEQVTQGFKRLGIAIPVWDRPVTKEEIQYFLDRWMFLQILSSNKVDAIDVAQVRAKSNWIILNYGDAMSSSPGEFLFGGGDFTIKLNKLLTEAEDDDDGGTIVNPDKGTIFAQAYQTVAEMIHLAKQLGWTGVHVVEGHPMMKWAAWMHAQEEGLLVGGFEPTEKDLARRERVKRSEVEDAKRFTYRR